MNIKSVVVAIPSRSGSIRYEILETILGWRDDPSPCAPIGATWIVTNGAGITQSRDRIAAEFTTERFAQHSHLLFIDDDMAVSYGNVRRLLETAQHTGADFVSAAYCTREPGVNLVGRLEEGEDPNRGALCRALFVGLGCALISRRLIQAVANIAPRYAVKEKGTPPVEMIGSFQPTAPGNAEDVAFCKRARSAGFRIILDPANLVPHMGMAPYPLVFRSQDEAA